MADFRRWILALALLSLFAGLANAQMNCTTNTNQVPFVRSEGFTEVVADIYIVCTGTLPVGTPIPLANGQSLTTNPALAGQLQIVLSAPVTSRLLGLSALAGLSSFSEATLLIDEPGISNNPFFKGNPQAFVAAAPATNFISTATTQCVADAGSPAGVDCAAASGSQNTFSGAVSGSTITFTGIPVIPPGTTTASYARVFHITNIRVNATGLGGSSITGAAPITASVVLSSNGQGVLQNINSAPTVAEATASLKTGNASAAAPTIPSGTPTALLQCNGTSIVIGTGLIRVLTYTPNFPTAFKPRLLNNNNNGTNSTTGSQNNILGNNFSGSESGWTGLGGNSFGSAVTAGLADYGTRLKAVFNNIPSGATIWVPTQNTISLVPGTGAGGVTNVGTLANGPTGVLVTSATVTEGNGAGVPAVSPASGSAYGTASATNNVTFVPLTGTTAVWEITGVNPGLSQPISFPVVIVYSAPSNTVTGVSTGNVTVTMSYAPTAVGDLGSTATVSGSASGTQPIPRFIDPTAAPSTIAVINACRTVLMYPFVSSAAGFDTGIGIANTTVDPFLTSLGAAATNAQSGTCSLNFYGTGAPTAALTIGPIAGGATYANDVISLGVTNFTGYMIAVCNFQLAHGYASLISGTAASTIFSSYLALTIPDPGNPSAPGGRENLLGALPATEEITSH